MHYFWIKVSTVSTLLLTLFLNGLSYCATTNTFSDLPGAVFHDLPSTGSADPFGPLVLSTGGGETVTMTSKEYTPGSTTVVEEAPAILGTYNLLADVIFGDAASVDPSVAPGDYAGEFETDASIVLNFDSPLTAVGATFALVAASGPFKTSVQITAFDGLDNTGNVLGNVATPDNPFLGEPLPFDEPFQFLYFVGVHVPSPQIQSLLIQPSVPSNGFGLDGIAVSNSTSPASADFDDDGDVDGHDFLKWQRGESPGLGNAADLAFVGRPIWHVFSTDGNHGARAGDVGIGLLSKVPCAAKTADLSTAACTTAILYGITVSYGGQIHRRT